MELLYFAIPMGLLVGAIFVVAFIWATKSGQFDDLDGPAHRAIHPQRPLPVIGGNVPSKGTFPPITGEGPPGSDLAPMPPPPCQPASQPSSQSTPAGTAASSPDTSI